MNIYLKGLFLGTLTFIWGALLDLTIDNKTRVKMMMEEPKLYNQLYFVTFMNLVLFAPFYFVIV